jgi:hypothetical protein
MLKSFTGYRIKRIRHVACCLLLVLEENGVARIRSFFSKLSSNNTTVVIEPYREDISFVPSLYCACTCNVQYVIGSILCRVAVMQLDFHASTQTKKRSISLDYLP